jgi:hypothetical protein
MILIIGEGNIIGLTILKSNAYCLNYDPKWKESGSQKRFIG